MKKWEKILWSSFLVGLVFKLMHWPGAGILTVFSLVLVALFYFYLGVGVFNDLSLRQMFNRKNYTHKNRLNLLLGALFGIVIGTLVIGILFKFMLWPGGNILLSVGLISLLLSLVVYFFLHYFEKIFFEKRVFVRVVLIGLSSFVLCVIQSDSFIDFYYPNDPEYANTLKQIVHNPSDSVAQENFIQLRNERTTISKKKTTN